MPLRRGFGKAVPGSDPLTACLDANGTYICTAFNPRCYIIQKVSTPYGTPAGVFVHFMFPVTRHESSHLPSTCHRTALRNLHRCRGRYVHVFYQNWSYALRHATPCWIDTCVLISNMKILRCNTWIMIIKRVLQMFLIAPMIILL